MRRIKKILSCVLAVTLILAMAPAGKVSVNAVSGTEADSSLVLNRPTASVIVSELTRVAYAVDSMKAPSGNNSVIVKSTPSGMPYLSSGKNSLAYAGETPVATIVTFTPGVVLSEQPVLSCNNSTVKWSDAVISNGTYTWTVTGGTAVAGSTLIFTVAYSYSELNAITGKTYTNTYSTSGTSYVEAIATPVGLYTTKRTYEDWGLGTTTKNRSYVASYILGKNTYGSLNAGGTGDGSVAFATGSWTNGSSGWTDEYGIMESMSDSNSSRYYNVAFKADSNRHISTIYFDTSVNSTLSDLNLRSVATNISIASESDERCTVSVNGTRVNSGIIATASKGNDEMSMTSDDVPASQLNIVKATNQISTIGGNLTSYFTGAGPGTNGTSTEYTVVFDYKTAAGWSDVHVTHSYSFIINTYNKGALRTLVEGVQSSDPTVKIVGVPEGDCKGYNPQSWYYSSGWEAFQNALNSARSVLDKPDVNQTQIDAAYSELQGAYDNLTLQTADYTSAAAYYNLALTKNSNNYTLSTWSKLQVLLDNYRDDYSILYQPAVDKMAVDIKAAVDGLEEKNADYSEMEELLVNINDLRRNAELNYHTTVENVYVGWTNLESVLSKCGCAYNDLDGYIVNDYLLISDQPKVNGYVVLIENAVNALRFAGANYVQASKAESAYKIINISYVVDNIATTLTAAYNNLVALHNRDLTYQPQIDAATAELNYMLSQVQYKPANTTNAETLITYVLSLDRTQYSDFTAVNNALNNLQSKLTLDIRYQNEIDRATASLQSAVDMLLANSADYTLVNEALESVADKEREILETYEDTYGFTADEFYSNWNAVTSAVNAVVRGLDSNHQSDVDNYAEAINNALANLQENIADYSVVSNLQTQAYSICTNGGNMYTQASIQRLLNTYINVENDLPISRQATVDAYATAIQQEIDNLEYLSADYSYVNAQITSANEKISADETYSAVHPGYSLYTNESLTAVEVSLAEVVEGLDIRYQVTVSGYGTDIYNAISALAYAPADYTAVSNALLNVPEDTSIYTSLSLTTLNTVINGINYNYTADKQATVDRYVTSINNAIGRLKLKNADYSAVNTALANVPADSSLYTEDSWQALQDRINAVVKGLDITHQDEVNAFAQNIQNAIDLLAYLSADYKCVTDAKALIPNDLSIYTDESVSALNTTLDAVDYYCNSSQQAVVNAYAQSIIQAVEGLTEKDADYSAVNQAITDASLKIDSGLYTDGSVEAVQNAINAVEEGYKITRQNDVLAFAEAINNAADAMEYKSASYTNLDDAIVAANQKISTGWYVEDSVIILNNEIAKKVEGLDITHQEEIDNLTESIVNLTKDLPMKLADYTELQNLLNKLDNSSSELYTIEYSNIDEVLGLINQYRQSSVRMDITIDRQSEVDAMVETINGYLAQLDEVVAESFEFSENLTVQNNYVYGFSPSMTKSQLMKCMEYENVTVNVTLSSSRYAGTGTTIEVISNATGETVATYTVIIFGDLNGSGKIDVDDLSVMSGFVSGNDTPSGCIKFAANLAGSKTRAKIDGGDYDELCQVCSGTREIDQASGILKE